LLPPLVWIPLWMGLLASWSPRQSPILSRLPELLMRVRRETKRLLAGWTVGKAVWDIWMVVLMNSGGGVGWGGVGWDGMGCVGVGV
jgi:hypothetical protein